MGSIFHGLGSAKNYIHVKKPNRYSFHHLDQCKTVNRKNLQLDEDGFQHQRTNLSHNTVQDVRTLGDHVPSRWSLMCRLHKDEVRNVSWQYGHLKGRWVTWMFMWRVREPLVVNMAWQTWQRNSFMPWWVLTWDFSTPADTNVRLHVRHLNGFSPVKNHILYNITSETSNIVQIFRPFLRL